MPRIGEISMTDSRILLGHVGVDSGQLMITDPCYIDSNEWISQSHPAFLGLRLAGTDAEALARYLAHHNNDLTIQTVTPWVYKIIAPDQDSNTLTQFANSVKAHMGWSTDIDMLFHDTYADICRLTTDTPERGGSLPYRLGHEGLAVAFRSGFGDGTYAVYATFRDEPEWGRVITKVEIILVAE